MRIKFDLTTGMIGVFDLMKGKVNFSEAREQLSVELAMHLKQFEQRVL